MIYVFNKSNCANIFNDLEVTCVVNEVKPYVHKIELDFTLIARANGQAYEEDFSITMNSSMFKDEFKEKFISLEEHKAIVDRNSPKFQNRIKMDCGKLVLHFVKAFNNRFNIKDDSNLENIFLSKLDENKINFLVEQFKPELRNFLIKSSINGNSKSFQIRFNI